MAREWADVYVPGTERYELESKALFYVPSLIEDLRNLGFNTTRLAAITSTNKASDVALAGRSAISKVLGVNTPVVYKSAIGFINVANLAFESAKAGRRGSPRDIVACVFRLREAQDLSKTLGVSAAEIAEKCNLTAGVAEAALAGFRLSYQDATSIWTYLRKREAGGAGDRIPATPEEFIRTDLRGDLKAALKNGKDGYVYRTDNLKAAPPTGHFWAID